LKSSDVYCSGFVRTAPVSNALKVKTTYQRDKAALSTEGEYVRLSAGSNGSVASSNTYQVVRPTRHVGSLGMHYLDVGQVQIVQVAEDTALARVLWNCESIEVGDVLIPSVHFDVPELPRNRSFSSAMTAAGDVKGSVVFTRNAVASSGTAYNASGVPSAITPVAEGAVVYIDLGKDDGLKPGDLFIVYHGEAAIGELAVLKVEERASSAVVTYSTHVLVLGDRVERR